MSPTPLARRRRMLLILVALAGVLLPAGAALLYSFPPGQTPFYPPCVFHQLTGLHCPGCGATRSVYALLHGNLAQAVAYNPLFVALLPIFALVAVRTAYEQWTGRPSVLSRVPRWSYVAIYCLVLAYGVLRNLDIFPLTLLAPHQL